MSKGRIILHIDLNCFYASVEQIYDTSLKGKPVAIAGNPKERRGIIITCSYEARARGVYTTMNVGEARRKCLSSSYDLQILIVIGQLRSLFFQFIKGI